MTKLKYNLKKLGYYFTKDNFKMIIFEYKNYNEIVPYQHFRNGVLINVPHKFLRFVIKIKNYKFTEKLKVLKNRFLVNIIGRSASFKKNRIKIESIKEILKNDLDFENNSGNIWIPLVK